MSLQLWIPGSAVAYKCSCGAQFGDKRKGVQHAIRCAYEHRDESEQKIAESRNAFTEVADKEMWRWGRERMARGKTGFRGGQAA